MKETLDTIILAREKIESLIKERDAALARAAKAEAREERWKRALRTAWFHEWPIDYVPATAREAVETGDLDAFERVLGIKEKP